MSLIEIDWNPDSKTLQRFGILLGLVVLAAGTAALLGLLELPGIHPGSLPAAGFLILSLSCLRPGWLRPLYLAWMGLAFPLGWVFSHLALALLFFGVFTLTGLLLRIFSRDRLALMRRRADRSYWLTRAPSRAPERYFRQF